MAKNRILIGIPLPELGFNEFWASLLQIRGIGHLIERDMVVPIMGSVIHDAHNLFVAEALERRTWDYLGWLEYDHVFPAQLLERAETYTLPVVGVPYFARKSPFLPIGFMWNEERTAVRHLVPEILEYLEKPGFYQVGAVGMGCTFIRREVFEKYREHYGEEIPYYAQPVQKTGRGVTDDVYFCRQVEEVGFKVYLDSSMVVQHITTSRVDQRHFLAQLEAEVRRQQEEDAAQEKVTEGGIVVPKSIVKPKLEVRDGRAAVPAGR